MERLWRWDRPAPVREVLEDMQQDRQIAYTTVMTVLDNLHRKGMVMREKNGRAYVYRPTRSRESHTAELMEQVSSGLDAHYSEYWLRACFQELNPNPSLNPNP